MKSEKKMKRLFILLIPFLLVVGNRADAGGFIRDAEIEKLIRIIPARFFLPQA